jgi:hypothetical protein
MIKKQTVVIICPKHPRHGRNGTIEIRDGKVTLQVIAGVELIRVDFADGEHPQAAYATRDEIAFTVTKGRR